MSYTINILTDEGRISLSYNFDGRDDLSALDESKRYSTGHPVEIWQKARLVARVSQGGEALND